MTIAMMSQSVAAISHAAAYYDPSELEKVLFAHAPLLPLLWLPFVLIGYRVLPWFLGPEVAAGLSPRRRVGLLLMASGAGVGVIAAMLLSNGSSQRQLSVRPADFLDWYGRDPDHAATVHWIATVVGLLELASALGVLMLAKLCAKWAGGRLSEAERRSGFAGVRAWVDGPNLVWAVAVTACVTTIVTMPNAWGPQRATRWPSSPGRP